VPFSQPGIVTIPLGFAVLLAVSLLTRKRNEPQSHREHRGGNTEKT
jgi:hypothetical protein